MWGMIVGLVQGIVTGVIGPVFTYLGKKQDVTLEGFKAATGSDERGYEAWISYKTSELAYQAASRAWWGPKLLLMVVGVPACLHVAIVFLDSTFRLGCDHYGCLGVPDVPARWIATENTVIAFVFGVSVVGPMASSISAWLHRR